MWKSIQIGKLSLRWDQKEGLANLASAITSPGDVILVPNPSYPIHQFGFIIAGAAVRNVPVAPDQEYMDALEKAVIHSVPKPTAVVLNYPNNPTAMVADLDFYGQVVDFCKYHDIYILSDLAYSEYFFLTTTRHRQFWRYRERAILPLSSLR